jgi:hypothetical protein
MEKEPIPSLGLKHDPFRQQRKPALGILLERKKTWKVTVEYAGRDSVAPADVGT